MKDRFQSALEGVDTIAVARERVLAVIEEVVALGDRDLAFVAGIISSEGDEFIERNVARLAAHAARIRLHMQIPVFSATDVFTPELFARLAEMKLDREERDRHFIDFWRAVLGTGHVRFLYMTPRWEQSVGARDEHAAAQQLGIEIIYVQE